MAPDLEAQNRRIVAEALSAVGDRVSATSVPDVATLLLRS